MNTEQFSTKLLEVVKPLNSQMQIGICIGVNLGHLPQVVQYSIAVTVLTELRRNVGQPAMEFEDAVKQLNFKPGDSIGVLTIKTIEEVAKEIWNLKTKGEFAE